MLFERNYIKKAFSAILLVMLLAIHSIRLLHSHPTNTIFLDHSCNNAALDINDNSETANLSDCSICSYQLGKDADDLVYASTQLRQLNIISLIHSFSRFISFLFILLLKTADLLLSSKFFYRIYSDK